MTSLCYRADGRSVSGDENKMYVASGVGTVCDVEGPWKNMRDSRTPLIRINWGGEPSGYA